MKIGEKAYAVRLLKRAGLSREEKQQVLSATGAEYDRVAIERALRRLFKDVEKSDHRSKRYERPYKKPYSGKPFRPYSGKSHKVLNADVESDFEEDDEAGVLVEDDAEDSSGEDEREAYHGGEPPEGDGSDEDEYYDALATFNSAKKKLNFAKKKIGTRLQS